MTTREERLADWRKQYEKERAEKNDRIKDLFDTEDMLDEDGYPTDAAHEIIRLWGHENIPGWFEFINSLWHLRSWGWAEKDEPYEHDEKRTVHRYYISTAGWSGNEGLIRAMQDSFLWRLTWVEARRGGHYIFEHEIETDTEDNSPE